MRRHAEWDGPEGGVNDGTNGSGDGGLTCFQVDQASGRLSAGETSRAFLKGAAEMTAAALLVGFARTIEVVLSDGQVIDTIIHY